MSGAAAVPITWFPGAGQCLSLALLWLWCVVWFLVFSGALLLCYLPPGAHMLLSGALFVFLAGAAGAVVVVGGCCMLETAI